MKDNKQHVQLPNNMIKEGEMCPKDLLVYATLKKHMNSSTKECFPSLSKLSEESGYSINTVRKSLSLLEEKGYIFIRKAGKKNIYKFSSYKNFEPLSYEFLESNLESNEKAYILATQQFLIKDNEGIGKTSYSNETLSKKLNISAKTISRLDDSLVEKGFLNIVKTKAKDPITGLQINEKFFHLDELGQAIIWTLQKHETDIESLKETTESNTKDIKIVLNENKEMKEKIEEFNRFKKLVESFLSQEDLDKLNGQNNDIILM